VSSLSLRNMFKAMKKSKKGLDLEGNDGVLGSCVVLLMGCEL
jgi:hypothetical protein